MEYLTAHDYTDVFFSSENCLGGKGEQNGYACSAAVAGTWQKKWGHKNYATWGMCKISWCKVAEAMPHYCASVNYKTTQTVRMYIW